MSGLWLNAEQPAHALQVEILDGAQAQIGWYTYDGNGNPLWLIGLGRVEGTDILAELLTFQGGRPPPLWDQANAEPAPWGTITLTFTGCDTGVLTWQSNDPDFGSSQLQLTRFSRIQGQRCFSEELFSQQITFSFERRTQGFSAVFADLPEDQGNAGFDLDFRREELPAPLHGRHGLRLSGDNHSDDLAMLVKAPLKGLEPDTAYRVEIEAEIASNVPSGCIGIGGSPGDSVYLKLGAAGEEPLAAPDPADGWLRLNIDFGQQSQEGANARVVGTLANSQDCENGAEGTWELKNVTTEGQSMTINTDADGTLWILAGSDSGFEGFSRYYITALRVRLEPTEP